MERVCKLGEFLAKCSSLEVSGSATPGRVVPPPFPAAPRASRPGPPPSPASSSTSSSPSAALREVPEDLAEDGPHPHLPAACDRRRVRRGPALGLLSARRDHPRPHQLAGGRESPPALSPLPRPRRPPRQGRKGGRFSPPRVPPAGPALRQLLLQNAEEAAGARRAEEAPGAARPPHGVLPPLRAHDRALHLPVPRKVPAPEPPGHPKPQPPGLPR